jgi:hypothetical protein
VHVLVAKATPRTTPTDKHVIGLCASSHSPSSMGCFFKTESILSFKQWQELRKHPNGSPPSRQARLSAASLSHCETLFCWGHSQCSRLHLFSAKPTGGVLLIDRRGHRGVGGVRPNAEAKSEGSGRLLRANSEQIHEKSNYCLVELALPACDARSNAEEAASHDQRTSKRKAKQAGTRRSCLLLLFRSLCTPSAQKIAYWHYWPAGRAKKALWDLTEHLSIWTCLRQSSTRFPFTNRACIRWSLGEPTRPGVGGLSRKRYTQCVEQNRKGHCGNKSENRKGAYNGGWCCVPWR